MDDDKETQGEVGATTEQYPKVELSPGEKLADNQTLASPVPGAQSAASEEIKKEVNLNTE
ncbi:MAG: hypothetical protein LC785_01965 [Acidobacteria bacterium]|nr:hypothetical protein [Acidobacteriota bacterium]MCA1632410.1 hypothetical protein [Acidobacteriota bacterium]MCA1640752.1 hypothetical protein [Acidobacteriota bacterium]